MNLETQLKLAGRMALGQFRRIRSLYIQGIGSEHNTNPGARVLISYIPYALKEIAKYTGVPYQEWTPDHIERALPRLWSLFPGHSMFWESAELVRQLLLRGCHVDYVFRNFPKPYKNLEAYDFIIDEWDKLPEWKLANPRARSLFYATGMEWSFWNRSELNRIQWLVQRKGVSVPPHRQCPPIMSYEAADLVSSFGNDYINDTFGPHQKQKIRRISLSVINDDIELGVKDWASSRNTFLWYAGYDWLSRGLDMMIEIFARKPHLNLLVVGGGASNGGIMGDPHFTKLYAADLTQAKNISYCGHMNPASREFQEIVNRSVAVVVPTALDSCSGSVLQAMHYGLVPVTTPAAGLDLPDVFPLLPEDSCSDMMTAISDRCEELAQMPASELEVLRTMAWEYARKNHTRKTYRQSISTLLDEFIGPK
jgi:hypothetical protein